jgi:hypothetical protein
MILIERNVALRNTHPSVVTTKGNNAFDQNGTPVEVDEVKVSDELTRLQAEYDSQEYARLRQAEYPSIDELVVAMWEGVVEERMASVTRLEGVRQAVKEKYPK